MIMKAFRSVFMVSIMIAVFACILPADDSPGSTGKIETGVSETMEIPFQERPQEKCLFMKNPV